MKEGEGHSSIVEDAFSLNLSRLLILLNIQTWKTNTKNFQSCRYVNPCSCLIYCVCQRKFYSLFLSHNCNIHPVLLFTSYEF